MDTIHDYARELHERGYIVIMPIPVRPYTLTMQELRAIHFQAIEMADEVFVVCKPTNEIGENTREEMDYAKGLGKPITMFAWRAQ